MRIGILTQPLHNNYGGLLQNYALQTVLISMGHEVYTINIKKRDSTGFRKYASILKRSVQRILDQQIRVRAWPTAEESNVISQHTRRFVDRNINTTDLITRKVNEKLLDKYGFDAYVVGSDQVWRPKYSPQLSTFFLDFLETNRDVKKIAYAASFGVSDWEFTDKQTEEYKGLIKLFDAISVREDLGVNLCKEYLNVDASHLLDPTMLLKKEEYISLVEKENIKESSGNLFTYILDANTDKANIVDKITNKYDLKSFSVMPPKRFSERFGINDCVFPPVEGWIRGFMDAEFVVTDSFHGTVFSILFNKPFISIANESRGITRFKSLLRLYQLEERLVHSLSDFDLLTIKDIDWENVNTILEREKTSSTQFLNEHL